MTVVIEARPRHAPRRRNKRTSSTLQIKQAVFNGIPSRLRRSRRDQVRLHFEMLVGAPFNERRAPPFNAPDSHPPTLRYVEVFALLAR